MNPSRFLLALPSFILVCGLSRAAGEPSPALPRSTPEAEGVSSAAIFGFVDAAEHKIDALHSFVLVRPPGNPVGTEVSVPVFASESGPLHSANLN